MEKFIITTGKTLDLAIAAALEELKLDRTNVSVEVLAQPKSGFLGFGAQPAKVKVSYGGEEPAPAAALSSASRSKPKPFVPKSRREEPPQSVPEKPKEEGAAETRPSRPQKKPRNETTRKHGETQLEGAGNEAATEPKVYTPAAPGSTEEKIETFLKGLLEHMGLDAVPHAEKENEDHYKVDLEGTNLGALIGHRGETLDAIQHLTNYSINRDAAKRLRINVDAENYRRKREESLERLARKVAGKVVRYRRDITLEPMNAYERHVIHATLQDYTGVTTFSVGSEPNRRVVVALGKGRNGHEA